MRLLAVVLILTSVRAYADLDRSLVKKTVNARAADIQACRRGTNVGGGRVNVVFTIAPEGNVTNATAKGLGHEVDNCVARVFRRMVFPKSTSPSTIHYPVVFADD